MPRGGRSRLAGRRPSSTTALDIGPDAIVVLQASASDRARVKRAIVHPLPVGLVVDGEVVNAEGLAVELKALFSENKLGRDVRVGLAHPRLMVRMVELPPSLHGNDLDGAVRHLAGDLLPVGLDQLVVDYRRVGNAPPELGGQQRILMAAARVDGIERLMQALDSAGLRPRSIQLAGLALLSSLDHPPVGDDAILYVQAGALTNVVITEDGEPLLVRAASAGSESIAAGLAERAEISHEEARAQVAAIGIGRRSGDAAASDDAIADAAALGVREGLRRIVAEIQSSRGFYSARPDARPIGAVVLTGVMTTWPGVVDALTRELHLPVLAAGRDSWPEIADVSIMPERLDIAVGLVTGGEDERPDLRPAALGHKRAAAASPVGRIPQVACAMVALVAAAIVYLVIVSNQVSSGREEAGTLSSQVVAGERRAADLKPYADFAAATTRRHDAIAGVAKGRFTWDRTLTELARVAPDGVWLTSVKATLSPTTQVEGASGSNGTFGLRGALTTPALELVGCAARERIVPAYIDRLHLMTGVTDVGFARAERLAKKGSDAAGGADCRGADPNASRFELVTYFKMNAAQAAAVAAANPATATATTAAAKPTGKSTAAATQTATATPGGSR
ncbi:MAG TPA: pilus assembly protein PilM [Solirubrobacteraceae bacterium]|nr:pilus assembly protein PilM [Solirubrobacteraceae bacterium]